MSTFRNTTYFEHAPDSPNERWGIGSSQFSRDFDLANGSYVSRLQAAYDFIGYAVVLPGNTLGLNNQPVYYIHRVIPMASAAPPGGSILPSVPNDLPAGVSPPDLTRRFYVQGISKTMPLGVPTGTNPLVSPAGSVASQYTRARMSVEFSTVPYRIFDDATLVANGGSYGGQNFPDEGAALAAGWPNTRYVTRHSEDFSRLIKVPYGLMQTQTDKPKLMKVGLPFREGGANVTYTWMRVPLEGPVPGANFSKIGSALGTINLNAFDGYAAGTLLLDTMATREYQGAFGEFLVDVTFKMIWLPHNSTGAGGKFKAGQQTGWNTVADVDSKGNWDYYPVTTANGVQNPFSITDFSTLFRPGSFT